MGTTITTTYAFFLLLSLVVANPGDPVIPETCRTISYANWNARSCASLTEAPGCGLEVSVNLDGERILKKNLTEQIGGVVCDPFRISDYECQLCAKLVESGDNFCLKAQPSCELLPLPLPSHDVGCFPKSRLDSVKKCDEEKSTEDPQHFHQCVPIIPGVSSVCTGVTFNTVACTVNVTVSADKYTLSSEQFPISQLRGKMHDESNCIPQSGCEACLHWDNVTLNETHAGGCGSVSVQCRGQTHYGPKHLGCFRQDQLSSCLHGCPNQCQGRGLCENSRCKCMNGYRGDDCSVPPPPSCKVKCNTVHAVCQGDKCTCDDGWGGDDCSSQLTAPVATDKPSEKEPNHAALIGVSVALGILVLAGLAFVGVYMYHKRKTAQPQFTRLDLIDDNELE